VTVDSSLGGRVLVFREMLLSGSETFIRNQVDALRRWKPVLAGVDRVASELTRPTDRLLAPGISDLRRRAFKVTRRSRGIRKGIVDIDPRLVHVHFGMDAVMLLPVVRSLKLPLVTTFHGVDVNVLPHGRSVLSRLYSARLPQLFAYADALIAPSEFLRDRLIALGAPAAKVVVLPIGVPVSPELEPTNRRGVAFVGRLTEVKGWADAIRAYAQLPSTIRMAHPLIVVGDGPDREALVSLARQNDVPVEMVGMASPQQVRDVLARSAVLLAPSRRASDGATEAFGLVHLEAALAGVPSIAYASGGVVEAVQHGKTGLLAREGDVSELADNLRAVLSDVALRERLASAARRRVVEQFDIEACTRALETLYDQVMKRGLADAFNEITSEKSERG